MPFHSKPVLLDLFCGAGGSAEGYHRAGFDVVGVDISAAAGSRYPFEFHRGDWREVAESLGVERFDAIHASPPCQAFSVTRARWGRDHDDLIAPVREFVQSSGLPYVIENVPAAPLVDPVTLCGTMFDLSTVDDDGTVLYLKRHRLFESNLSLVTPPCRCAEFRRKGWQVAGVYGGGPVDRRGAEGRGGYVPRREVRDRLMGVDWMNRTQLSQAIPPAYTEWIGGHLLATLKRPVAA